MLSRLARAALAFTAMIGVADAQSFQPGTVRSDAALVFRDFNQDGVPTSGPFQPRKDQIRSLIGIIGDAIASSAQVSNANTWSATQNFNGGVSFNTNSIYDTSAFTPNSLTFRTGPSSAYQYFTMLGNGTLQAKGISSLDSTPLQVNSVLGVPLGLQIGTNGIYDTSAFTPNSLTFQTGPSTAPKLFTMLGNGTFETGSISSLDGSPLQVNSVIGAPLGLQIGTNGIYDTSGYTPNSLTFQTGPSSAPKLFTLLGDGTFQTTGGVSSTGPITTTDRMTAAMVLGDGLPFTPKMFGAACNSNGTPGNGNDDTVAVQAAINAAEAIGGTVKITASTTKCRTTAPLILNRSVTIDGDYCQPVSNNNGAALTPLYGSWLYFDHAGKGLYQRDVAGFQINRVVYRNFCTMRNQPAPPAFGSSWSPSANDFDIFIDQDDSLIEHLMLLNPTKALRAGGRTVIDDVRGQPYQTGLAIDNAHDTPRIHNVHWWPFGADNKPMEQYVNNNLDAFVFRAQDNAHFSDSSAVGYHYCVHLSSGSTGTSNKLHASNIDCDLGQFGVVADANGVTAQFSNFTAQGNDKLNGETAISSSNAVLVSSSNVRLGFSNFRATNFGGTAVSVGGGSNVVMLDGQVIIDGWGTAGTTAAAIVANTDSTITVNADPLITSGPSSGAVFAGSGTVNQLAKTKVN